MTLETVCYIAFTLAAHTYVALTVCQWIAAAQKIRRGAALELGTLRPAQYRQVAEWDHGPLDDGVDWERYTREMEGARWLHSGIYSFGKLVGAISLECVSQDTVAVH